MQESFASFFGAALRFLPPLLLLWLAFFFGRTLRYGATPLIEQIARRSSPTLSPRLRRYTRRLTAIWCAYFIAAAIATALSHITGAGGYARLSLGLWSATVLLFVGERWLRRLFFSRGVLPRTAPATARHMEHLAAPARRERQAAMSRLERVCVQPQAHS